MHKFVVQGGRKLEGTVAASGSKNSALPLLFATILSSKPVRLSRVPHLKDIDTTLKLLRGIGAEASHENGVVNLNLPKLTSLEAPYDLVRTMRASILMLGPMLARERSARVSLPGGCAIGSRPVDIHLTGLEALGAELKLEHGYVVGVCPKGLKGAEVKFKMPSVGATEHLLMAASLAEGRSVLRNCAREPEIVDLVKFLRAMGAKIKGEGESDIEVEGVASLGSADYEVMFDRIEAGTLLFAGLMTGGRVRVDGMDASCLTSFLDALKESGAHIEIGSNWVAASAQGPLKPIRMKTEPYPGFPTDLQAQLMAYLALVPGESHIEENIFENRFMHVPELNRMNAHIDVQGPLAVIHGKPGCYDGATVMATDLRASASLVFAGLAARGETQVRRIYHLDRGYESLEKKLSSLGASIQRELD
ncbi:MAG: UDP-N-acetylglucosamine 1-carboxyvinyltransferase [Proteobacteria bacterium]|nr:MAG: UDP-N-acetylglucosamine 1-carboxyvinyltransferase [Pseudomonadota bacterium]